MCYAPRVNAACSTETLQLLLFLLRVRRRSCSHLESISVQNASASDTQTDTHRRTDKKILTSVLKKILKKQLMS